MLSTYILFSKNFFLLVINKTIKFKTIINIKNLKYISNDLSSKTYIKDFVKSSFDKTPNSKKYESFWYKQWQENNYFKMKTIEENQETFSMILPPPNITGDLHMGHALTVIIEDVIYRFKKIENPKINAIFIPSYDHAGLGLWNVLDKYLISNTGKRILNLTKDEFVKISDNWKNERINSIRNQLKSLGSGLDFSNEKFTLDPEINKAINQAFFKLFDKGLIYRSKSMVNWCYHLNSNISDIEIEWIKLNKKTTLSFTNNNKMDFGIIYKFSFKLEDNLNELTVATTRPYTIPGDTAILVNPDDERYQKFIGKNAVNPLTGDLLPIVSDSSIKKNIGTGAVKITPACSPVDFEFSKIHNLKLKNIFDEKGNISVNNFKKNFVYLNGLNRFEVQNEIIKIFQELNQFKGIEDYESSIPICSKSGDLIEYKIKTQWFLNLKIVNKVLAEKIEKKDIKFIRPSYANSILNWIKSDKDWCISRQTWWGHNIPMYKVKNLPDENINWIFGENYNDALEKAKLKYNKNVEIEQDSDVMDTWFSSSLIPLIYLDWPNTNSILFKKFYPLTLIETGFDILNFWVYKMLCISWYLVEKLPFNLVFLHGMVVDSKGKKMSKSIGNVIDPLDVINGISLKQMNKKLHEYFNKGLISKHELKNALEEQASLYPNGLIKNSVDGLRLCLLEKDFTNELIKINEKNIKRNRNFINKIWQSFRLFYIFKNNLCDIDLKPEIKNISIFNLELCDKWILSSFSSFLITCRNNYKNYEIQNIHIDFTNFFLHDFCDFYLELIKPSIYEKDISNEIKLMRFNILHLIFNNLFLIMHPVIPFLTEDLYQKLKYILNEKLDPFRSIMNVKYPEIDKFIIYVNTDLQQQIKLLQKCVSKIRFIKQLTIKHKKNFDSLNFTLKTNLLYYQFFKSTSNYINYLTKTSKFKIEENNQLINFETNELNDLIDCWHKDTYIMQISLDSYICVYSDFRNEFLSWAKLILPVKNEKN